MAFSGQLRMRDQDNPSIGTPRTWAKTACLALSLVGALVGFSSPVRASQIPAGCSNNGVSIDIQKSATQINNGDTVTYTITAENGGPPSCNTINNAITGHCPGPDGQPLAAAATITVQTPIPNPMGVPTAQFTYGTFSCVVSVNTGVTSPIASATLSGSLQDNPQQDDPFSILKTVSVIVAQPQPPQPPNGHQIPTLSGWVMIMLAVFLALVGATVLRKKHAA